MVEGTHLHIVMNEETETAEKKEAAKISDALTFLCSEQRTGKLVIRKEGREGEVYIEEGGITHAQLDECIGLPALLFMLSWERGTHSFTPKETADQRTIEMETSNVLSLLAKRTREWDRLNADNPFGLPTILCLHPQASGTIRLKKEEWDILARIDGRRSLKDISDEMYMPPLDLFKAIQRFRKAGLIGKSSRYPGAAGVGFDEEYLAALERELNLIVGPIAPILLEEALQDLEESTEARIEDKRETLLKRLSTAMPDEEKRSQFLQRARILAVELSTDGRPSEQEKKGGETEE